jgi:hypothetical protein
VIPTYTAEELKRLAKSHPAFSEFWFDCWLERNRQPDDKYSFDHKRNLAAWLIRFANCLPPQIEKKAAQ